MRSASAARPATISLRILRWRRTTAAASTSEGYSPWLDNDSAHFSSCADQSVTRLVTTYRTVALGVKATISS